MIGATDLGMAPTSIDLASGDAHRAGVVPRHDNFVAGLLAEVGVDPRRWWPGVEPLAVGAR